MGQECQYELQLLDDFGDGWNGAELTITVVGGESATYSLNNITDNGNFLRLCFPLVDGDSVVLGYSPGAFDEEASFIISDNGGNEVYASGNGPATGDNIFSFRAQCDDCPPPSFCSDITFDRVRSSSVDFFWNSVPLEQGQTTRYLIEYGPSGFLPGEGNFLTTTDTIFRVQPLIDTTTYDVYISTLCAAETDTSFARGPFTFTTPLSNDVGISVITDPVSGCELGSRQIRVGIENFGGLPQSFIPFDYSVNGFTSGVVMPQDGLYTGVVGVDSIEFTTFDQFADFSNQGSYEVKIWTALEGDQDVTNDTITVTITNAPVITDLPYFEDFETSDGDWTVGQEGATTPSWEYGIPDGNAINSAGGGENAWVTNLDGPYSNDEFSYLYSPCFDFSSFTEDPIINFFLFVQTESGFDQVYLESTTDDVNWERVGTSGDGLNWYNDATNEWWEGNGGFGNGWVLAVQELSGLAGEDKIRLRFVFTSDISISREGVGIDNVYVGPRFEMDLAATSLSGPEQSCGTEIDPLTVSFFNLGNATATDITLSYQANGGEVVTETFPDSLEALSSATYTFMAPYDGSQADINEIEAWVTLSGDGFSVNDSIAISVLNRTDLPLFEDFESGAPANWQLDSDLFIGNTHNAGSTVLYDNLWAFDPEMRVQTANYGPVEEGDTLFFDYRIVDFSSDGEIGTVLGFTDRLTVSFLVDCDTIEQEVLSIGRENHIPVPIFATVAVPITAEYWGSSIQVVFTATWGNGDYYVDLDNINIRRCAESFLPIVSLTDASTSASTDGMITVEPTTGEGPFTYSWDSGDEGNMLSELSAGAYNVTITDAQGCTESIGFVVGFLSSNEEFADELGALSIAPNPTLSSFVLSLDLQISREVNTLLYNQYGQLIEKRDYGSTVSLRDRYELGQQPAGIYYLRVVAGDQFKTLKIIKGN